VTWGETGEESYRRTIDLVARAEEYLRSRTASPAVTAAVSTRTDAVELLLRLRGRLGHRILRLETGPEERAIADRADVRELALAGPATADHVLRIGTWSCVIDGDPVAAIDEYEARYRAYFARHADGSVAMNQPLPRVFLVPGLGMITAGKTAREAAVVADVARHTLAVAARGKDAHGSYRSLDEEDLFHVDYWPLELYKLTLAPPPAELEGRVTVITGAGSGIGRAVARKLAALGSQLVLLDLDPDGCRGTCSQIAEAGGLAPLSIVIDVTDEAAVAAAIRQGIETYGGVDALVSNAGIAAAGEITDIAPELWRRSLEVNTTSHFLVTSEVMRAMRTQGLGGSIVYVASKNAFGPGAGFGAYSAAKAAQVQLSRIAALEGGACGIRANAVNPDAVFDDSKLWSEELRRERAAAHGVPVEELEEFYVRRNLLRRRVTGDDVAEAVAWLVSDRSRVTTGTVIAVDGGVASAFPR
jgi:NAD(P)-dependent dehydrogenase (short-subunit alcohol dehydrogenase family)